MDYKDARALRRREKAERADIKTRTIFAMPSPVFFPSTQEQVIGTFLSPCTALVKNLIVLSTENCTIVAKREGQGELNSIKFDVEKDEPFKYSDSVLVIEGDLVTFEKEDSNNRANVSISMLFLPPASYAETVVQEIEKDVEGKAQPS